jgi:hypothetical protein
MHMRRINKKLYGAGLLALLLSIAACKKDKDKEPSDQSCVAVAAAGRIKFEAATETYTFRTSGGGHIKVALGSSLSFLAVTISHEGYANFKIELWGDTLVNGVKKTSANHESLNGKHIKDRFGSRRTIIFPDGAKITLVADGEYGPLRSISIYDGAESHRINPACNVLVKSATNATMAKQLDDEEVDGETASFEITATGLLYFHLYKEETPGNKAGPRFNLGELFLNKPNQVNDYYDDPRLGAT